MHHRSDEPSRTRWLHSKRTHERLLGAPIVTDIDITDQAHLAVGQLEECILTMLSRDALMNRWPPMTNPEALDIQDVVLGKTAAERRHDAVLPLWTADRTARRITWSKPLAQPSDRGVEDELEPATI